jgi:hypothetical protein
MASRELRLLKLEADAVRRELNEWRDRANLPRVEEPVRSEAFSMVLNGEVEILTSIPGMDEEEDAEGLGDNEDDLPVRAMPPCVGHSLTEDADDFNSTSAVKPAANLFAQNVPAQQQGAPHLAHILPRPSSHGRPVIAQNVSNVSFENPAMASLYDQQAHVPSPQYQMQFNVGHTFDADKSASAAWNNQIFSSQQLQQQLANQHGLFSSSATSHGSSSISAGQPFTHQSYYPDPPRQQPPVQHVYGSPVDSEDASSVSSGPGFGGRDSSMSGSTYGSPQATRAGSVSSQPGSYEVPSISPSSGIPARMSAGGAMWGRDAMEGMAAFKPNIPSIPIAVGGSSGGGFAMMM